MTQISIIAAIDKKQGLGKDNKLLFKISEDLTRFKKLTLNHPIIMGRKTFESIGRPLPQRTNIIVTRNNDYSVEGCLVCHSLDEAIGLAKDRDKHEIFIIGGGQIYQQAIDLADKLYLTLINKELKADTFFPDYSKFSKIIFNSIQENDDYSYQFLELKK